MPRRPHSRGALPTRSVGGENGARGRRDAADTKPRTAWTLWGPTLDAVGSPRFEPGEGRERSGERATGALWGRSPTPLQPILAVIGLIFALGRMGHAARGPSNKKGSYSAGKRSSRPQRIGHAPSYVGAPAAANVRTACEA